MFAGGQQRRAIGGAASHSDSGWVWSRSKAGGGEVATMGGEDEQQARKDEKFGSEKISSQGRAHDVILHTVIRKRFRVLRLQPLRAAACRLLLRLRPGGRGRRARACAYEGNLPDVGCTLPPFPSPQSTLLSSCTPVRRRSTGPGSLFSQSDMLSYFAASSVLFAPMVVHRQSPLAGPAQARSPSPRSARCSRCRRASGRHSQGAPPGALPRPGARCAAVTWRARLTHTVSTPSPSTWGAPATLLQRPRPRPCPRPRACARALVRLRSRSVG